MLLLIKGRLPAYNIESHSNCSASLAQTTLLVPVLVFCHSCKIKLDQTQLNTVFWETLELNQNQGQQAPFFG